MRAEEQLKKLDEVLIESESDDVEEETKNQQESEFQ
jgi:hypothetical protein